MGSNSTGGLLAGLVALIGGISGIIVDQKRKKGNNSSQQSQS